MTIGTAGHVLNILVTGLLQAGLSVVCGVRKPEPNVFASLDSVFFDFLDSNISY